MIQAKYGLRDGLLEVEVVLGVVVTDVFNHLVHTFCLIASVWYFAILDVRGNEVAEY